MLANTQMMGLDKAFPDVPISPVPIPYPNSDGRAGNDASIKADPKFQAWANAFAMRKQEAENAGRELAKAGANAMTLGLKAVKAITDVEKALDRITKLQGTQIKVMKSVEKLERDIARGFDKMNKLAKSSDVKAKENAKIILIAKGQALMTLMATLEGVNKQLKIEQTKFEKMIKNVASTA